VGDDSHVGFGKKFPGEKRKCEAVRCHDATASCFVVKVPGKAFSHFRPFIMEHHSICGIDFLTCQD
jgi:hypothetical protein